jgi:hypothetical protein
MYKSNKTVLYNDNGWPSWSLYKLYMVLYCTVLEYLTFMYTKYVLYRTDMTFFQLLPFFFLLSF